jgi:GT2 family glycosyltransferase/glycosyltransferase involved in cell wall biosynthesis
VAAPLVKVACCSGTEELNAGLVRRVEALYPDLPLYVVAEFPPDRGRWIPYNPARSFAENFARCRAALAGKRIRIAAVLLVPNLPYRRLRWIAWCLSPRGWLAYNEHFGSFMLRPRCLATIVRHLLWRTRNFLRWQTQPGGPWYTFWWKLARPAEWRLPLALAAAHGAGVLACLRKGVWPPAVPPEPTGALAEGVTVVIPSRNGRDLLAGALPHVLADLPEASEVIVVDNGSQDGTVELLRERFPGVRVECSTEPLSFARAVNRGIRQARFARVCLLNNDMRVYPGFFAALDAAFQKVPDLFCATAQIFFEAGKRREETGKAVWAREGPADFPVRCEEPLAGEDGTFVLYGSGGCSLYDTRKLRALGGAGEAFEPAYVEDLDLGYRAWLRGWPSVFCAAARVEHRHRATTARYYSAAQLAEALEVNYLRFLCRAVAHPDLFWRLWREALRRLHLKAAAGHAEALPALTRAWRAPWWWKPAPPEPAGEEEILALGSGQVAVFPGRAPGGRPVVMIASPYPPYPLAHGAAVRIYNLMRRAAGEFTQVLICFVTEWASPPRELLEVCAEVIYVLRRGKHNLPPSVRPDTVEEFASPAFCAALRQAVRVWRPGLVQLEFTQMAQYAAAARPARTLLVEHDITFDLYEQMLRLEPDWDTRRQLERWRRFETQAWREVDAVAVMSEQDRRRVRGARAEVIENGVDLERFRPAAEPPEPGRLLFIGSFGHLPNLLGLEFFLKRVWPRLEPLHPVLHVIAGRTPAYFLDRYRDRVCVDLSQPGIELEGFVADVRPAYRRAAVVIVPLVASAGTNIKVLEAMAMGKAMVSTPAGVNGLDLGPESGVALAGDAEAFAGAVTVFLQNEDARLAAEQAARRAVAARFGWDEIARRQSRLYRRLLGGAW